MADDATVANRRMKIFFAWLASCFVLIVFQPLFNWSLTLIQFYLEKTPIVLLVVIGGLSATDAVYAYTAKKNGETK